MITNEEFELHAKWLRGKTDGVQLVKVAADLTAANLTGANLTGADLSRASLTGANLSRASLTGANLSRASLTAANLTAADLTAANLTAANLTAANLTGANLTGADLTGADLTGAKGLPIATDAADRLKAVAQAALQPDALEMRSWHTCGTTHCIAGWAIHLAGEPGRIMESMMGSEVAGLLLLGTDAHRHFHDSNEKALEYLRGVVADG
jgi:hypothetical protein